MKYINFTYFIKNILISSMKYMKIFYFKNEINENEQIHKFNREIV